MLGIAVGLMTLLWPGVTALVLITLVGAWAVVTGAAEIWAAVRFRRELRREWVLAPAGVLSVVAGVVIWARPDVGAVALAQVIGVYALLTGGLVLGAAWCRHRAERPAGHMAQHARHV